MSSKSSLEHLESAERRFSEEIRTLPKDLFLAGIDDWTPRDIAAHLVWWNRNMLAACESLRKGKVPTYYADGKNDYRNINAQAIAEFSSKDCLVLLGQMECTLNELKQYLLSLDSIDWDADHGVTHYRGGVATVRRIVESLTGDYASHTQQIDEWKTQRELR